MPALRPTPGRRCQERAPQALTAPRAPRWAALLSSFAPLLVCHAASAGEAPKERAISTDEVVSWLDSKGDAPRLAGDQGAAEEDLVPVPPPRHQGFVVESSVGALGFAPLLPRRVT